MLPFITALVIGVLIAADQLIKIAVKLWLEPIGTMKIIDGVLQLNYVENTGAAFSSFSDNTTLLSIITAILLILLTVYLFSKKIKFGLSYVALTAIIAGGAGNLIDRIIRGYVVDYIEPLFVNFAVFNFADILVTVGAALLIAYLLYDMLRQSKKKDNTEKSDG